MKGTTKIRNFDRRITGSSVIDENLNEVSTLCKQLHLSVCKSIKCCLFVVVFCCCFFVVVVFVLSFFQKVLTAD